MLSRVNLVPAFQSLRKLSKIWKKETVAENRTSTLSVAKGLKYVSKCWRPFPNSTLSSHFYFLLTPKQESSQLEVFSVLDLVSLTLLLHALFLLLEEELVVLLYRLDAHQLTSTLRCQNYPWFYSEFNAQSNELSPSIPKSKKVVLNLKKRNSRWKT